MHTIMVAPNKMQSSDLLGADDFNINALSLWVRRSRFRSLHSGIRPGCLVWFATQPGLIGTSVKFPGKIKRLQGDCPQDSGLQWSG